MSFPYIEPNPEGQTEGMSHLFIGLFDVLGTTVRLLGGSSSVCGARSASKLIFLTGWCF